MKNDLVLKQIKSVDIILSKLEKLLSSLNTKTASIGMNVYNREIDNLQGSADEFEETTTLFSSMIRTIHIMYDKINEEYPNVKLAASINFKLNDLDKVIRRMRYKTFTLRKGVQTKDIIEIQVVSKAFMTDIKDLKTTIADIKESTDKLKYQLTI